MVIDGIMVTQHHESDTVLRWDFTIDNTTFFQVTLGEDDNNLRAWKGHVSSDRFRPLTWLLPQDPDRRRLDENSDDVAQAIAAFVREQIAEVPQ